MHRRHLLPSEPYQRSASDVRVLAPRRLARRRLRCSPPTNRYRCERLSSVQFHDTTHALIDLSSRRRSMCCHRMHRRHLLRCESSRSGAPTLRKRRASPRPSAPCSPPASMLATDEPVDVRPFERAFNEAPHHRGARLGINSSKRARPPSKLAPRNHTLSTVRTDARDLDQLKNARTVACTGKVVPRSSAEDGATAPTPGGEGA
jgi:hypothetical protein